MTDAITQDDFLGGSLQIKQLASGFRSGSDSVLLASALIAGDKARVLDVGAGAGVVSLCAARRLPGIHVTGVEVISDQVLLSQENARLNNLGAQVAFQQLDIFQGCGDLVPQSFDHVISNPPYFMEGTPSPNMDRQRARGMSQEQALLWLDFCLKMAVPRGYITLVYPSSALSLLLSWAHGRVGNIVLLPLYAQARSSLSKRLLIRFRKGVKTPLTLCNPLYIHQSDGAHTTEVQALLRDGKALSDYVSTWA